MSMRMHLFSENTIYIFCLNYLNNFKYDKGYITQKLSYFYKNFQIKFWWVHFVLLTVRKIQWSSDQCSHISDLKFLLIRFLSICNNIYLNIFIDMLNTNQFIIYNSNNK